VFAATLIKNHRQVVSYCLLKRHSHASVLTHSPLPVRILNSFLSRIQQSERKYFQSSQFQQIESYVVVNAERREGRRQEKYTRTAAAAAAAAVKFDETPRTTFRESLSRHHHAVEGGKIIGARLYELAALRTTFRESLSRHHHIHAVEGGKIGARLYELAALNHRHREVCLIIRTSCNSLNVF